MNNIYNCLNCPVSTSYRLTQARLMSTSTKNNESNSEDKPSSISTSKQGGKNNIPFKTYI